MNIEQARKDPTRKQREKANRVMKSRKVNVRTRTTSYA